MDVGCASRALQNVPIVYLRIFAMRKIKPGARWRSTKGQKVNLWTKALSQNCPGPRRSLTGLEIGPVFMTQKSSVCFLLARDRLFFGFTFTIRKNRRRWSLFSKM